jgi:hypothetical protein
MRSLRDLVDRAGRLIRLVTDAGDDVPSCPLAADLRDEWLHETDADEYRE